MNNFFFILQRHIWRIPYVHKTLTCPEFCQSLFAAALTHGTLLNPTLAPIRWLQSQSTVCLNERPSASICLLTLRAVTPYFAPKQTGNCENPNAAPESSPPVFRLPVRSHSPLSSAALQSTADQWEHTAALFPFKDPIYPPIRFLFVSMRDSYKGICIFLGNCSTVSFFFFSDTDTGLFCRFEPHKCPDIYKSEQIKPVFHLCAAASKNSPELKLFSTKDEASLSVSKPECFYQEE